MLNLENKQKHEKEIVAEQRKSLKHIYSTKIKPGHKMFKLNLETKEITEAEFQSYIHIDANGKQKGRKKIIQEKNCMYMPALNVKNAIKRFKKVVWL